MSTILYVKLTSNVQMFRLNESTCRFTTIMRALQELTVAGEMQVAGFVREVAERVASIVSQRCHGVDPRRPAGRKIGGE
jgi:hypothetical protein